MKNTPITALGAHVSDELLTILDQIYPEESPSVVDLERPIRLGFVAGRRDLVRTLHTAKRLYEDSLKRAPGTLPPEASVLEDEDDDLPPLRLA